MKTISSDDLRKYKVNKVSPNTDILDAVSQFSSDNQKMLAALVNVLIDNKPVITVNPTPVNLPAPVVNLTEQSRKTMLPLTVRVHNIKKSEIKKSLWLSLLGLTLLNIVIATARF